MLLLILFTFITKGYSNLCLNQQSKSNINLSAFNELLLEIDPCNNYYLQRKVNKTSKVLHKFLKIAVDKSNKSMIDLFTACGGKKNSHKFIENIIIAKMYDECLIPTPLSIEEARKALSPITSKFQKKSIIKIAKEINEIERETLILLTKKISQKELESTFESKEKADDFISKNKLFKELEEADDINDYISYYFTPNIKIQATNYLLNETLEGPIRDQLPDEMTEYMKQEFIRGTLSPKLKNEFALCMKDGFEVGFDDKKQINKTIERRRSIANSYTMKDKCDSPRYFDNELSDTEKLTACSYKSVTNSLEELLILTLAKEKDKYNFSESELEAYSTKGWEIFKECVHTEVNIKDELSSWAKINSLDLENALTQCSTKTEIEVSQLIAVDQILKEESFNNITPHTDKKKQLARSIVKQSFEKCEELRKQTNDSFKLSRCVGILEVNVANELLITEAKNLIKDKKSQEIIITKIKACNNDGHENIFRNDDYSSNINCIKSSITTIAEHYYDMEFKNTLNDNKESIKDKKHALSLKKKGKVLLKKCMQDGLSNMNSWNEIKSDLSEKVNELKDYCSNKLEATMTSDIVLNEATTELKLLAKEGFIKKDDIGNILALSAFETRKISKVPIKTTPEAARISKSFYNLALKRSDSIEIISNEIEKQTIKNIHLNLIQEVREQTSPQIAKGLEQNFTNKCLKNIYDSAFKDQGAETETSITYQEIKSLLIKSLQFTNEISSDYAENYLVSIKKSCDKGFESLNDLFNSKIIYGMIVPEVYESLKVGLNDSLIQSVDEQIKNVKAPHKDAKLIHLKELKKQYKMAIGLITPTFFTNEILTNDLKEFIANNQTAAIDRSPVFTEKLTKKLMSRLFTNNNQFRDQFVEATLINEITQQKITSAFDQADEGLWGTGLGSNSANVATKNYFSKPSNLKRELSWSKVAQDTRDIVSKSMFYNEILPKLDIKTSRTIANVNKDKLKSINKQIETSVRSTTQDVIYSESNEAIISKQALNIYQQNYPNEAKLEDSVEDFTLSYIKNKLREEYLERDVIERIESIKYPKEQSLEDRITEKIKEEI